MARPKAAAGFTITQLENMLQSKRIRLDKLARDRSRALKRLAGIEDKIRRIGGNPQDGVLLSGARGPRRNAKSLVATMVEILTKAGKPQSVGDILQGVQASGYRSNSASLRAIINQTLIKERKRFGNVSRGVYQVKK